MSIKKLLLNGAAIFGATLIVCGMSFTTFAAEEGTDAAGGTQAAVGVPQEDQNSLIGYDVQNRGFNIFGVDPEGNEIRSTYANAGYDTFVNDRSSRIDDGNFVYGQPYERNGLITTITPTLTDNAVNLEYALTNNTDAAGDFQVRSTADTMIGHSDDAVISGDANSFTMVDTDGVNRIRMETDRPFDTLWYGPYSDRYNHFNDGVMTDTVSNVDSGVIWGWNVNLQPGETVRITTGAFVGDSGRITPTAPAKEPDPVIESGPRTPDAPRVWCALTEKGNALPIQNMGIADAQTYTLFIDISGATALQYKDVIKQHYANAPAGGVFVLGTSQVSTFDKEICETLESRKDVTIKMVFPHEDHVYQITIPAGSAIGSALDDNGFAGFLKIGSVFGMTQIG